MADRSDTVMPTGINVDRMAWFRRLQLLLDADPTSLSGSLADALFAFVDEAMTAAREHALLDTVSYDEADPATRPQHGQLVAVLRRYHADGFRPSWASLNDDTDYEDAVRGDRWLWVPSEATDG